MTDPPTAPTRSYLLTRWLFLRSLGLVYLVAFGSLWTQIDGLVGSNGILPAERWIEAVRERFPGRYLDFPTLAWLDASDGFLHCLCGAGVLCSVLVVCGIVPAPALALAWVFYLSLAVVCQDFLSFQWDTLLLETGFAAIFFAPWRLWPRLERDPPPSQFALWLVRWLLFRLMFESGCVKLLSGDPTWRDLTALDFHYETQPLPTWIGWYAHQLPGWFQKLSVAIMFVIEIAVPFLVFAPRRLRQVAFVALVGLQSLIALTGNYCFFNWLAITLCLPLLDDVALRRLVAARLRRRIPEPSAAARESIVQRCAAAGVIVLALVVGGCQIVEMFLPRDATLPQPFRGLLRRVERFRTINDYGLFRVMTTARPEIVVEGSNDGVTWRAYEFKYKPGDPARRPPFVAPHHPRLDWQMWFAALGDYRQPGNYWFMRFLTRLLEGSPDVLELLAANPFPGEPPGYVRAVLYEYRFSDWTTGHEHGTWWQRERLGLYCPALTRGAAE